MPSSTAIAEKRPPFADPAAPSLPSAAVGTVYSVLLAASVCHLLNDTVQALIPAIYPLLRDTFQLTYGQIGLITLTFQCTSSILQPVVGFFTDKKAQPFSLPVGMFFSLIGLIMLARAGSYPAVIFAAAMVGLGSAIFHPEASRLARLASGGQHGLAQSVFQVGGNAGSSLGPLLAILVVRHGQGSVSWFAVLPMLAMVILTRLGFWYQTRVRRPTGALKEGGNPYSARRTAGAIGILLALIFSKYFYLVSISTFFIFYLRVRFGVSTEAGQLHLFAFQAAVAAGTIIGGPIGDRIGRKRVIWASILGMLPFTLALPYSNLFATGVLSVVIGMILASAFPAIIVYAQELLPGKVGLVSGLFFGFAFGMAGIGAAVLGHLADHIGVVNVYRVCSFLPLMGLLAGLLPNMGERRA